VGKYNTVLFACQLKRSHTGSWNFSCKWSPGYDSIRAL